MYSSYRHKELNQREICRRNSARENVTIQERRKAIEMHRWGGREKRGERKRDNREVETQKH